MTLRGRIRDEGLIGDVCEVQCWEGKFGEVPTRAWEVASVRARSRVLTNVARIRARNGDPAETARPIVLAVEAVEMWSETVGSTRWLFWKQPGRSALPTLVGIRPETAPARNG